MPRHDRWFYKARASALVEGAIWDRTRGDHEASVRILKRVEGRVGVRYVVEGLESGRRWPVTHMTLMGTYEPRQNT